MNPYRRVAHLLERIPDLPLLIVRVTAGLLFIDHGLQTYHAKGGLVSFQYFLKSLKGIPAPSLMSHVIPALEVGGGILLVAGLLTRVVALVLAGEMLVTGFWVKLHDLHAPVVSTVYAGAEVDFLYLIIFVLIFMAGPGRASLDARLKMEGHAPRSERGVTIANRQPVKV